MELFFGELGNEMKPAAKDLGKGKRVKRDSGGDLRCSQSAVCKVLLPLVEALIVVRQRHAVRPIAHPVHGPQRRVVERAFTQVIFQDDAGPRDACRFAQELRDVSGVVEYIDEQAGIERFLRKRKSHAVERTAWNMTRRAGNDFHSFNSELRPPLGEQSGNCSVAATDIENTTSPGWNQRGHRIGQDANAPAKDERAVAAGYPREGPGLRRRSHRVGNGRRLFHIL